MLPSVPYHDGVLLIDKQVLLVLLLLLRARGCGVESELFIVHVDQLAIFQIFRVVYAPTFDVPRIAFVQN